MDKENVIRFGSFFKDKRLEAGFGLREFCLKYGLDPAYVSKLERGRVAPPKNRAVLEKYARHLRLGPGSEDWDTFFDLAAAGAGRIPDEILSDEEAVAKLPILFRALRGKKVTMSEIKELMQRIKKG